MSSGRSPFKAARSVFHLVRNVGFSDPHAAWEANAGGLAVFPRHAVRRTAKPRLQPSTARPQAHTRRDSGRVHDPGDTQPPVAVLGGGPRRRLPSRVGPRLQVSRVVLAF